MIDATDNSTDAEDDIGVEDMPPEGRAKGKLRVLGIDEILSRPTPTWRIDGLLPTEGLVVLHGPPKCGKTFVTISFGLSIATGTPWQGLRVQQGTVVYVLGEGVGGFPMRISAWLEGTGVERSEVAGRFFLVPQAVVLNDADSVRELVQALEAQGLDHIDLIVIDTLARCMAGDENTAEVMGNFVRGCDRLRERFGAQVLVVHHDTRKGDHERGSSALPGAVDTKLRLQRDGDALTLHCVMQKDADECDPIPLALKVVEVGEGEDGTPVTSCFIRSREELHDPQSCHPMQARCADRVCARLMHDSGEPGLRSQEIADDCGLTKKQVLAALNPLITAKYVEQRGRGPNTKYAFFPEGRAEYERIVPDRSARVWNDSGSSGGSCSASPPPRGERRGTIPETDRSGTVQGEAFGEAEAEAVHDLDPEAAD